MQSIFLRGATLLIVYSSLVRAQQTVAMELLSKALRLADFYNWADAAPAFAEAETLFVRAGDERNAMYAKLGRIRSNIERDQQILPLVAAQLGDALANDPLLQNDKELRMFCFIVKGDIDTETNTAAMKGDWEQVQKLAQAIGNSKWQYRALAQLGVAAFYDADIETARKNVGTAITTATKAGDAGAQIRFLTMLAIGLVQSKMYEQALAYADNAIKIADRVQDTGYQFAAEEVRINALVGLGQLESAQLKINELLKRARETGRIVHEATGLGLAANVANARNDRQGALSRLEDASALGKSAGLTRLLSDLYGRSAEIHRENGNLEKAETLAEMASAASQESGEVSALPRRLQTLAELQVARGRYSEADQVYDRAETFLDSMIGNSSTVIEKTAVITTSGQIYSKHFALIANHFNDPRRAYNIIEQVRGRAAADLLEAGLSATPRARIVEREISQLRLKLMAAKSIDEVHSLRDQIFLKEQARWTTSDSSLLKAKPREVVKIEQLQENLAQSALLLEYVIADPNSYCLAISRSGSRIVRLGSKAQIETLIRAYLEAVKAKLQAISEARNLYDALLRPIQESAQKDTLIIVRDGQLHTIPFDALMDGSGRYVVETQIVLYSPSATSFYLLKEQKRTRTVPNALLAIGGVPYSRSSLNRAGITRGFNRTGFADLPSSGDEVQIARAAFPRQKVDLLLGDAATETAFKAASLADYRVIHFAAHGFADSTFPDRAALVLLSDRSAGEDGFLQASEIVQLRIDADLVVLSACDTAVGPLLGQEGVANLSRAFLLAGARTVISTLWQVEDSSSLFLMKRFYMHLSTNRSAASALTAAKRDMLRTFSRKTLPHQWAAFIVEGAAGRTVSSQTMEGKR